MSNSNNQKGSHSAGIPERTEPSEPSHGRREFMKTAAVTAAGLVASTALNGQNTEAVASQRDNDGSAQAAQQAASRDLHNDLHNFVGRWDLEQKQWQGPNDSSPKLNRGHCECSVILDGLATLMITEIPATGYKGVALQTYNITHKQFELAYIDTTSKQGVVSMVGQPAKGPARSQLREKFSSATQQRVWSTQVAAEAACLPQKILLASEAAIREEPMLASAFSHARTEAFALPRMVGAIDIPMRLVENQVSSDSWVLEFFAPGPGGKEFLVQQNVFTRAGKAS